jgi:hypothetical protein
MGNFAYLDGYIVRYTDNADALHDNVSWIFDNKTEGFTINYKKFSKMSLVDMHRAITLLQKHIGKRLTVK